MYICYFCSFSTAPCPDLSNPTDGVVTMTGNSVGDTATYTCNNMNGEIVLTCQRNGTWNNPPPTCAGMVVNTHFVFFYFSICFLQTELMGFYS